MEKEKNIINYKFAAIFLLIIVILTYTLKFDAIFESKNTDEAMQHDMSKMNTSMDSMTMDQMVSDLQGKFGKDLEKAFLNEMITHHKGAVEMSQIVFQDPSISPTIKTFAENIIKAQTSEINMMNTWLKDYK